MRVKQTLVSALVLATLGMAWSQTPGSASPPAGSDTPGAMGSGGGLTMGAEMSPDMRNRMQSHMQAMRDLRTRMNAAGSPGERQALMEEHLQLMGESMTLMQQLMGPHTGGPRGGMPMPGPGMPGHGMPPAGSGGPGSVR